MVLDVGLKPWMVKITLLYQRDVTFSRKYPVTLENSVTKENFREDYAAKQERLEYQARWCSLGT